MTKINDIKTLQSEIDRLENELRQQQQNMKVHASLFKESLKPGNLLASGLKKVKEDLSKNPSKFAGNLAKTGLLLLAGRWLLNPGKLIRKTFGDLFEKKVVSKKEKKYYKFDDRFDDESN